MFSVCRHRQLVWLHGVYYYQHNSPIFLATPQKSASLHEVACWWQEASLEWWFSQILASEWKTAFVVSRKMPWCALLTAVKNYNKSLGKTVRLFLQDRDQDQMFKTKTKTSWSKTKTKTFNFVLEVLRDQELHHWFKLNERCTIRIGTSQFDDEEE